MVIMLWSHCIYVVVSLAVIDIAKAEMECEACRDGDIRLYGGSSRNRGRLEMCINNTWYTVCDSSWTMKDATVACAQLGYSSPETYKDKRYTESSVVPYFPYYLTCTGGETTLISCKKTTFSSCNQNYEVHLVCQECTDGQLRLVDNVTNSEGIVEMCKCGGWGTICDDSWGNNEAMVTCFQLGFSRHGAEPVQGGALSMGNAPFFLDVACTGTENELGDCFQKEISSNHCTNKAVVSVRCQDYVGHHCNDGDVRLVGGLIESEGTVEFCRSQTWNSVCSCSWGYQETFVVCGQLNLPVTEIQWYTSERFSQGSGSPNISNWRCYGNESSLGNCIHDNNRPCNEYADAGVSCKGVMITEARCINKTMRLGGSGDPSTEGRVEYCINGLWGTVSDVGFDTRDGEVVCKRLGYQNPRVQVFNSSYYGQGRGPIVYESLNCTGKEHNLEMCAFGSASYSQSHSSDVGIRCLEKSLDSCSNNEVRLVNGSAPEEGRVEICLQEEWSAVIDDNWDRNDTRVVCRQLGYNTTYSIAYHDSHFGDASVPVLFSNVGCNGSEKMLNDCMSTAGHSNGIYGNTAGVKCFGSSGCTEGAIRLVGGVTEKEGDVQICRDGVWGYICGYKWGKEEARVVCQQLNYSNEVYSYSQSSFFSGAKGSLTTPIVADLYDCRGNESSLSLCNSTNNGTYPKCNEVGGVICEVDVGCIEDKVQLVDGNLDYEGRVEICTCGVWTTIADTDWDYNGARLVCQELSYSSKWAVAVTGSYFTSGNSRIYPFNLSCAVGGIKPNNSYYGYLSEDIPLETWYSDARVGVACEMDDSAEHCNESGSVRLVGGANEREGRVEVCLEGYWGTVCSDGWTQEDALVVCKQAGYDTLRPIPLTNASFGRGSGPVHMTSVNCIGHEKMLSDCTYSNGIGVLNCHHARDAGVMCTSGLPKHYSIQISTTPSEGPFPIGSVVHLHCNVSPNPQHGGIYKFRTSVPGVNITHHSSTHSNASVTITVGHTKYGYYYCQIIENGSTLATGFTVIQVQPLLLSSEPKLIKFTGESVTLTLAKTVTTIDSYLYRLTWYSDMARTGFGIPINIDDSKYILSADNMSLTITDLNEYDAGIYTARYNGLIVYPYNILCEQQLLQALRHYPVFETFTFMLSVDGSDRDYFGEAHTYIDRRPFTTLFHNSEEVTLDTSAHLPSETIYMARLKDGIADLSNKNERLFYSVNNAYSGLYLSQANNVLHQGFYETQLQLTTIFMDLGCDPTYTEFVSSPNYLGISNGTIILQSTMQRMTYYESPDVHLTSTLMAFDLKEDATLQCSASSGYPPIHNISLVKNSQVIVNRLSDEITYTTNGGLSRDVYGLYECIVNNTAGIESRKILLQHKAPFTLIIVVDSCDQWNAERLEEFGQAILGLMDTYCTCVLDSTKFLNGNLSCSRGEVSFSSVLAHASDDGTVTATNLIETFEAALSRQDNPTITVDGQELDIHMPVDNDTVSSSTSWVLLSVIIIMGICLCALSCFIILCVVYKKMNKKKKTIPGRAENQQPNYNVLHYDAKKGTANLSMHSRQQFVTPPGTPMSSYNENDQ